MADNKRCERCGRPPAGFRLLDFCATCSRDLCDACMKQGCCGNIPAISGTGDDHNEEPADGDTASSD